MNYLLCMYVYVYILQTGCVASYLFHIAHSEVSLYTLTILIQKRSDWPRMSMHAYVYIYMYPCIYLVSHYKLQRHFYEVVKSTNTLGCIRCGTHDSKIWRDCNLPSFFKQTSNQLVLVIEKNYHLVALLFLFFFIAVTLFIINMNSRNYNKKLY